MAQAALKFKIKHTEPNGFVVLESPNGSVMEGANTDEEPEVKGIVAKPFRGLRTKGLKRMSVDLFDGKFATVNTVAGKYIVFLNPGVAAGYTINNVVNAQEWSSVTALFDEFFVEKVQMVYIPNNKYSAVSASGGTLVNLNSGMMVLAGIQHNTGAYADSGSTFIQSAAQANSKIVNSGDSFKFTWKNSEKFSWDGTLGDMTTAGSTQAWCSVGSVAKYGGFILASVPSISAAAGTVLAYQDGSNFGVAIYKFRVHFRVRA